MAILVFPVVLQSRVCRWTLFEFGVVENCFRSRIAVILYFGFIQLWATTMGSNNNNNLIYIAPACRMTSEALDNPSSLNVEMLLFTFLPIGLVILPFSISFQKNIISVKFISLFHIGVHSMMVVAKPVTRTSDLGQPCKTGSRYNDILSSSGKAKLRKGSITKITISFHCLGLLGVFDWNRIGSNFSATLRCRDKVTTHVPCYEYKLIYMKFYLVKSFINDVHIPRQFS